jgi:hypothetical protein
VWVFGGGRTIKIMYSQATNLSRQASQYPPLPIQNLDRRLKSTHCVYNPSPRVQIGLIKQQVHRLHVLPNARHHHLPSPIFLRLTPQRPPDRVSHVQTIPAFKTHHGNPEMAEKMLTSPRFRHIDHHVSPRGRQWRVDSDDQGPCCHLIE